MCYKMDRSPILAIYEARLFEAISKTLSDKPFMLVIRSSCACEQSHHKWPVNTVPTKRNEHYDYIAEPLSYLAELQ